MKRTKQTVLFPFGENGILLHPLANIDQCMKSYKKEVGYFFTAEELNEYTANVIKQTLETAAENVTTYDTTDNSTPLIDEKSITNTFEESYKKFEV